MSRLARGGPSSSGGGHSSATASPAVLSSRLLGGAVQLGESKVLRSRHLDTLELLESYSKESERLQQENKQLKDKISSMSSMTGDPLTRIQHLETVLGVERDSNVELNSRIKINSMETDRLRSELSSAHGMHRDALAELTLLRQNHAACAAAKMELSATIDQLTQSNKEAETRAQEVEQQRNELRIQLEQANERIFQLNTQLTLGASKEASGDESRAHDLTKQKLAKCKEKVKEKETHIATQLQELQQLRASLAQAQAESSDKAANIKALQADLSKLTVSAAATTSSSSDSAPPPVPSARKSSVTSSAAAAGRSRAREEHQRKEKEWNAQRKQMQAQIEELKKALVEAQAVQQQQQQQQQQADSQLPSSSLPTTSSSDPSLLHLQRENHTLRQQLDHATAAHQHLRLEHSKVTSAFNKLLSSGAGAMGVGGLHAASTAINITSGKGGKQGAAAAAAGAGGAQANFQEFVGLKREKEGLQTQVNELQRTVRGLQQRLAQVQSAPTGGHTSQTNTSASIPIAMPSGHLSDIPRPRSGYRPNSILPPETMHSATHVSSSAASPLSSSPSTPSTSFLPSASPTSSPSRTSSFTTSTSAAAGRRSTLHRANKLSLGGWPLAANNAATLQR